MAFINEKRKADPFAFLNKKGKLLGLSTKKGSLSLELAELFIYNIYIIISNNGNGLTPQGAWARFVSLVAEEDQALSEYLADWEKNSIVEERLSNKFTANPEYISVKTGAFMRALILTNGRFMSINLLANVVCKLSYNSFITGFYRAIANWERPEYDLTYQSNYNYGDAGDNSVEEQAQKLKNLLGKFGIPPVYFCAWSTRQRLGAVKFWGNTWDKFYLDNRQILEETLSVSVMPEKLSIFRMLGCDLLHETDCIDEVYHAFFEQFSGYIVKHDITVLGEWMFFADTSNNRNRDSEKATAARFSDWGKMGSTYTTSLVSTEIIKSLPGISPFVDKIHAQNLSCRTFDLSCLLLTGIHSVADRYLCYLAEKQYSNRIEYGVLFFKDILAMSPADTADYILGITDNPSAFIRCLSKEYTYSLYYSALAEESQYLKKVLDIIVSHRPDQAAVVISDIHADVAARLILLEALYEAKPDYDEDFLINRLGDRSKKIRQYAVSFLIKRKGLAEKIRPLLDAKKKDLREAAEQIMSVYESQELSDDTESSDIVSICMRNMPKGGIAGIRWAFPGDLPVIRRRDSDEAADVAVVQCYLVMLLTVKTVALPPLANTLRGALRDEDLHAAAAAVYNGWISEGSPTKNRGAMLFYALHAKDSDVITLRKQIEEWAESARGAIAAEAVRAMALGGSDMALMTVDNIGRKFKNKQVRKAGIEAFSAAAEALGTTAEALGDRIIPNLGFDARGERLVDYGTRSFTALLSPELTITLRDENDKVIKSLPKPGVKDDPEKAEMAKREFTALKKSLKTVVDTQRQRLELALATGRFWDWAAWEKLFVQNPIMHSFAVGLIWALYEDGKILNTFRYMDDGSFTDAAENDFDPAAVLDEKAAVVGLVHPLDLDEELLGGWRRQLEDYEVIQPFNQLGRGVYRPEEDEDENESLVVSRFGGKVMLGITLANRLQKDGWYRGSVQDAGCFYTFYREMGDIAVQIYFSGMFVSPDPMDVITLGEVGFYKAGTVQRGSYVYDDVTKEDIIPPSKVPARLFSEVMLSLYNATASSNKDNWNWRDDRSLQFFMRV
jgi:hypothetical protein